MPFVGTNVPGRPILSAGLMLSATQKTVRPVQGGRVGRRPRAGRMVQNTNLLDYGLYGLINRKYEALPLVGQLVELRPSVSEWSTQGKSTELMRLAFVWR